MQNDENGGKDDVLESLSGIAMRCKDCTEYRLEVPLKVPPRGERNNMSFDPEKVERANPESCGMDRCSDGRWVLASDYDQLLQLYRGLKVLEDCPHCDGIGCRGCLTPAFP